MDFRDKFKNEVARWIDERGFDTALDMFADFLQQRINAGESGLAIEAYQAAWEEVTDEMGNDYEPPDFEAQQAERDRREYEAGKAEGELRRAERKIYGNELADAFHAQDDLNRYNRGED